MIKVTNVTKRFGNFKALDGLDMNVGRGQIYGLVGPNGAGKSTIIRHLTGAFKQDAGEILIDGQPVYDNVKAKRKIGYIPDDVFYFNQSNMLDMKAYYKAVYPNFDEKLFDQLKECFTAVDYKKNIRSFSKGMQKQAAFHLAVCARPEILILDEPVDGLDPVMRRQIWKILMNDVAKTGMTVLVSSHNLRELEDVCDHVGIMNHGKLMIEKSLSDLQSSVIKIQLAFKEEMPELPSDVKVLADNAAGRVHTLIIRDENKDAEEKIAKLNPLFMDLLPLSLEEIFIYELGGEDYAVKDILF